jgi:hypothetical protein
MPAEVTGLSGRVMPSLYSFDAGRQVPKIIIREIAKTPGNAGRQVSHCHRLARSQPGEVAPIADRKEYAPLGGAVVGRKVDDAMSGGEWH